MNAHKVYNPLKVESLLNDFMQSKAISFVQSRSNRNGWIIDCPVNHKNGENDDCLIQPMNQKGNGFIPLRIHCRHSSCLNERIQLAKDINKEWGFYLEQHYVHDTNDIKVIISKPLVDSSIERSKQDIDKKEMEEKRIKYKDHIIDVIDFLNISALPKPIYDSPKDDYNSFIHHLWNKDDIIFLGNRFNTQVKKVQLWNYDESNEFTTGNIFKEERNRGRNGENTLCHKYQIIENDKHDKLMQYKILMAFKEIGYPLIMIVDSGGKSLHGWFRYSDENKMRQWKNIICNGGLDFDPATFSTCQPVRCPGMFREDKGKYQRIIYFDGSNMHT